MAEPLGEYRRKRRFETTPEPAGVTPGASRPGARFVVQEHHATRLHWDLRLERDGVLASWAVPNGLPDHPEQNRKAIHTEDHPLEYLDFHGTIPKGGYGAGEMTIWDQGTYTAEKWEAGKLIVVFDGERLRGRYSLFRAGRSEKDWMIHRMDPPEDPAAEPMPDMIEPMLAKLGDLPRDDSAWSFEVKWDGVRAIAHSEPGRLRLLARSGNEITEAYPELRPLNRALSHHRAILDGEVVAFDEAGRPSFEALQGRIHLRGEKAARRLASSQPVAYMIFDLLWLDGHSLCALPYTDRRKLLEQLELDGERWSVPASHRGDGAALLEATRAQGLEGVVCKRLDSRYEPGRRNGAWIKVKNQRRQEVVIGGWTQGKGRRDTTLGALQVGVMDGGELRYAGRVGTGFTEAELARLGGLLAPLAVEESPFAGRQPPKGSHFVRPELVCEVVFTEWTKAGVLRHPAYKGLRDDKDPADVVREEA